MTTWLHQDSCLFSNQGGVGMVFERPAQSIVLPGLPVPPSAVCSHLKPHHHQHILCFDQIGIYAISLKERSVFSEFKWLLRETQTGPCPRLCKSNCALKRWKYNYAIYPYGLYWWGDASVVQLTHHKHHVPHCQMTPARPHLGPMSTHGLTVTAQCSSAMGLQY